MASVIPTEDLPPGYTLHAGYPSVASYRHLRASSGLTPVTESMARGAVTGAWYGCYVVSHPNTAATTSEEHSQPVAMGRIIGDGGWYFHIVDMATLPEHQRKGLGAAVMRHLLAYIRENSPKDGKPVINLFADPPGRRLYEKTGFVEEMSFGGVGMVLVSSVGYTPGGQVE